MMFGSFGQAVLEKIFEYYGNIHVHVYCPGVGTDQPLGSILQKYMQYFGLQVLTTLVTAHPPSYYIFTVVNMATTRFTLYYITFNKDTDYRFYWGQRRKSFSDYRFY